MTPYLSLALLGAFHGINPGMGWLFAVALGVQERDRRAVWRAFLPLAAGHTLAVAILVGAAAAAGLVVPVRYVKWAVAAALLALGVARLARHRHPRWGGMRVGARDLAVWSLLMATAHGAGLMALPFVLGATERASAGPATHAPHAAHMAQMSTISGELAGGTAVGALATLAHTLGYLLAMTLVAAVVYEKLGVRVLRRAWVNLDLVWAAALVATALLTPFL